MNLDFVDEFAENGSKNSTMHSRGGSFFDPPLAEEDRFSLSTSSSQRHSQRQILVDSHLREVIQTQESKLTSSSNLVSQVDKAIRNSNLSGGFKLLSIKKTEHMRSSLIDSVNDDDEEVSIVYQDFEQNYNN